MGRIQGLPCDPARGSYKQIGNFGGVVSANPQIWQDGGSVLYQGPGNKIWNELSYAVVRIRVYSPASPSDQCGTCICRDTRQGSDEHDKVEAGRGVFCDLPRKIERDGCDFLK